MPGIENAAGGPIIGAKVDGNQRLWVSTHSHTDTAVHAHEGKLYHATSGSAQMDLAGGPILYMKNLSDQNNIVLETLDVTFEIAEGFLTFRLKDTGAPGGTTVVTAINGNTRFPNLATSAIDFFKPTTPANGITGLTDGGEIAYFDKLSAGKNTFVFNSTVILAENGIFVVETALSEGGSDLTGRVSWHVRFVVTSVDELDPNK